MSHRDKVGPSLANCPSSFLVHRPQVLGHTSRAFSCDGEQDSLRLNAQRGRRCRRQHSASPQPKKNRTPGVAQLGTYIQARRIQLHGTLFGTGYELHRLGMSTGFCPARISCVAQLIVCHVFRRMPPLSRWPMPLPLRPPSNLAPPLGASRCRAPARAPPLGAPTSLYSAVFPRACETPPSLHVNLIEKAVQVSSFRSKNGLLCLFDPFGQRRTLSITF